MIVEERTKPEVSDADAKSKKTVHLACGACTMMAGEDISILRAFCGHPVKRIASNFEARQECVVCLEMVNRPCRKYGLQNFA